MYPRLTATVTYPWEGTGTCMQTVHNKMSPCFASDLLVQASDRGTATQIPVSLAAQQDLRSSSRLSTTQAHVLSSTLEPE